MGKGEDINPKRHMKKCKIRAAKNSDKSEVRTVRRVWWSYVTCLRGGQPRWASPGSWGPKDKAELPRQVGDSGRTLLEALWKSWKKVGRLALYISNMKRSGGGIGHYQKYKSGLSMKGWWEGAGEERGENKEAVEENQVGYRPGMAGVMERSG